MPQILYRFGFDPSEPTTKVCTPTAVNTSAIILILWTSWCDLMFVSANIDGARSIFYIGTSLNSAQQQELRSLTSALNESLTNPACHLSFFGSIMHDGVRGYICKDQITVFRTPAEEAARGSQCPDVETWNCRPPIAEIRMRSDESLVVSNAHTDETGNISAYTSLHALKVHCTSAVPRNKLASFSPVQLVTNATTATALTSSGLVYTCTVDPRYPACLGRSYTGTSSFEPVPYLSETRITKIASGGYMTAAISEDGELFMWGQANPGEAEELSVLQGMDDNNSSIAVIGETAIWADVVQDEDVKCLSMRINRTDAVAYDVAVGFGHVLVAANNEAGQHVVFAGGRSSGGQLGTCKAEKYVKDFEEVVALRGKRVVQLAAAGWSSFVVTEE